MFKSILASAIVFVITALLGAIFRRLGKLLKHQKEQDEKENADMKAVKNGVRTILRNELIKTHREYVEKGLPVPLAVKEYTEKTYCDYHELDGNGTGTSLYNDIMDAPTEG